MKFRLFGGVDLRVGGRLVDLGPARQRCVLAVLLLHAGREVSTETLIDRVWGDEPPAEVRNTLHSYISRLRRVLRPAAVDLRRTKTGYAVTVAPDAIDVHRFTLLVADAAPLPAAGRAERLHNALEDWTGEPLSGLTGAWVEQIRQDLHRQRVGALIDWADAAMELGDHREVVQRLGTAVDEYPLVEPLAERLLHALHRAGRTAEALEHYERLRIRLRDDLGVQPSAPLADTHLELLRGPQAPRSTKSTVDKPRSPAPAQLPLAPNGFVGRRDELRRLDEFHAAARENPAAPGVVLVSGIGGIGKTALALTWARTITDSYPDGQLYVNLHGYARAEPARAIEVLSMFLRALDVPAEDIPLDEQAASGLYRSLLADRRMLIVLDNAANLAQLSPLLPSAPGCLVVITSRDRLGDLVATAGAQRIPLEPLRAPEAIDVLTRQLGAERISGDPAGAAELAELCSYFPLALRIIAANLGDTPDYQLADYAAELRGGDRLTALETRDATVAMRSAFDRSYHRLPADQRQAFRLLGLHPGPDFTAEACAALSTISVSSAKATLRSLLAASLIESRSGGRYVLHDLIRGYAAERAHAEESDRVRTAALRRLADYYVHMVNRASQHSMATVPRLPGPAEPVETPDFADDDAAMRWLDAELPNAVAIVETAEQAGVPAAAWQLSDALRGYLRVRSRYLEGELITRIGLETATRHGDHHAKVVAHTSIGYLLRARGRFQDALRPYTTALELATRARWQSAVAALLTQLGAVYHRLRRHADSVECLCRAVELATTLGQPEIECIARLNLGAASYELGMLRQAVAVMEPNIPLTIEQGMVLHNALNRGNLGLSLVDLGEIDAGLRYLEESVELTTSMGYVAEQANCTVNLAGALLVAGRLTEAREQANAARAIARETNQRNVAAEALSILADLRYREGDLERAHTLGDEAILLGRDSDELWSHAVVATRLAEHADRVHDTDPALEVVRSCGNRVLEARVRTARADLNLAAGDVPAARREAEQALALATTTGYRDGAIRAQRALERTERWPAPDNAARDG